MLFVMTSIVLLQYVEKGTVTYITELSNANVYGSLQILICVKYQNSF
jgi:hypothetical protein